MDECSHPLIYHFDMEWYGDNIRLGLRSEIMMKIMWYKGGFVCILTGGKANIMSPWLVLVLILVLLNPDMSCHANSVDLKKKPTDLNLHCLP